MADGRALKWVQICGGQRTRFVAAADFAGELNKITVNAEPAAQPDGSPPPDLPARMLLRQELLGLIKRAQHREPPQVRDEECDVVREGDTVAELRYPRPGNLDGWHYRLYAGLPNAHRSPLRWNTSVKLRCDFLS